MAVREDLVASAVKFLQDPNVASSSVESKIAFLESKNLTKYEIDAALARVGTPARQLRQAAAPSYPPASNQPYGGYQKPPYGWQQQQQQQPPPVPKRDWRDWFIMATVMGGVGFGLYTITKRYISPLIAPPTPEKLEQDKKAIDDKFDRAFALIDQLSADTAELKNSEQTRTERLDKALSDLETVINDLKMANRRREDDAQRVRDDVQGLKDSLPRAMTAQKEITDSRLRDLNGELKSLKTLLAQRMSAPPTSPGPTSTASNYLKPTPGNPGPSSATSTAPQSASVQEENKDVNGKTTEGAPATKSYNDYISSLGQSSPFSSGMPASKAAIPSWQMAMQTKSTTATPEASGSGSADAGGA